MDYVCPNFVRANRQPAHDIIIVVIIIVLIIFKKLYESEKKNTNKVENNVHTKVLTYSDVKRNNLFLFEKPYYMWLRPKIKLVGFVRKDVWNYFHQQQTQVQIGDPILQKDRKIGTLEKSK